MKREATLTLIVALAFAGCLAAPEEIETASQDLDTPLLDALDARSAVSTGADDTIVLRLNATPEGGIAGFWWTIPEGLVLTEEDDDEAIVAFVAAPVLLEADRTHLTRWTLLSFLPQDGELALSSLAFGAPFTVEGGNVLGGGGEEIERSIEPFHFLIDGDLAPGNRIGFVVAGVADRDVELALVLQPLKDLPDKDADAPEDTEAFLASLGEARRLALPAEETEGLHQVALYVDGASLFGGYTVVSGPVEAEGGRSGPASVGASRHQTVRVAFEGEGFALSAAGYFASGAAVGSWTAIADAHGVVAEGEGNMASLFGAGLSGAPGVVAIGEGEASSLLEVGLDTASAGFDDGVFLVSFDVGATLTDLLGLPAKSIQSVTDSGGPFALPGGFGVAGVRVFAPGLPTV